MEDLGIELAIFGSPVNLDFLLSPMPPGVTFPVEPSLLRGLGAGDLDTQPGSVDQMFPEEPV